MDTKPVRYLREALDPELPGGNKWAVAAFRAKPLRSVLSLALQRSARRWHLQRYQTLATPGETSCSPVTRRMHEHTHMYRRMRGQFFHALAAV